ncbi:Uncharacterized conserved protein, DUF2252 family [Filimonas lacunae]|uniref:Uncharacterized conserved protein, DUF2252 family n=2 Tax=Filimonas lacunae TaxID=477680 RepID=A0A1N7QW21_9BACT|nr:Uncharacterized conserved protein, DUF2252 family [Filimonas lacunae]
MAENAFSFFRGSCHLFYEDLQRSNALPLYPVTWVCGDMHLENYGTYKGDNRLVYFDINDFDEGALAPATWELARMVTSIFVGLTSLGIPTKEARKSAEQFLAVYSSTLAKGRSRYIEPRTADGMVQSFLEQVATRRQKELVRERTILRNHKLLLKTDKVRLFPLDKSLKAALIQHIQEWFALHPYLYKNYQVVDVAFRVAGTGSLGVNRYLFLLRSDINSKKALFIDMKQALPSCLSACSSTPQPVWESEAARVVAIQERMQNIVPALLSTTKFGQDSYVLKEMQPTADKIRFLQLKDKYKDIACVIADMALLTASAQLRSAARQGAAGPDELIAFGRDNHWQQGIIDYAATYARQVKNDYKEYLKQYKAGFFDKS